MQGVSCGEGFRDEVEEATGGVAGDYVEGVDQNSAADPDCLPIDGGLPSAGRGWAAQMLRYLKTEFLGGNRAPRGQDPLHLLAADERADGWFLGCLVHFQ